jgi:hypothetical protein
MMASASVVCSEGVIHIPGMRYSHRRNPQAGAAGYFKTMAPRASLWRSLGVLTYNRFVQNDVQMAMPGNFLNGVASAMTVRSILGTWSCMMLSAEALSWRC